MPLIWVHEKQESLLCHRLVLTITLREDDIFNLWKSIHQGIMKSDLQNTKLKKGKLKGYSGGRKCETFVEKKNVLQW